MVTMATCLAPFPAGTRSNLGSERGSPHPTTCKTAGNCPTHSQATGQWWAMTGNSSQISGLRGDHGTQVIQAKLRGTWKVPMAPQTWLTAGLYPGSRKGRQTGHEKTNDKDLRRHFSKIHKRPTARGKTPSSHRRNETTPSPHARPRQRDPNTVTLSTRHPAQETPTKET